MSFTRIQNFSAFFSVRIAASSGDATPRVPVRPEPFPLFTGVALALPPFFAATCRRSPVRSQYCHGPPSEASPPRHRQKK